MNPGLLLLLTGLILAYLDPEVPKILKTILYIVLIIAGLIWGGGSYFHL